jgi:hypothetical protein
MYVSVAKGINLTTWNNDLSDIGDNTLIPPGTEVFRVASSLKNGQRVVFSGSFIPKTEGCIDESSITLRGKIEDPDFIFRFSRVALYDAFADRARNAAADVPPALADAKPAPVYEVVPRAPQAVQNVTEPETPIVTTQSTPRTELRSTNDQANCLSYVMPYVKLKGTIEPQTFPGPPNYDSVRKGDAAENVWVLTLDSPICTLAGKPDPDGSQYQPAENSVGKIQLTFTRAAMYDKYRQFVGGPVIVSGALWHAYTGHHHTNVMLQVYDVSR